MYHTILITLDGRSTDRAIIEHIKKLALELKSQVALLHVADGWAARKFGPDAISPEVNEDKEYLKKIQNEFLSLGITTTIVLAFGDPAEEIIKWVNNNDCNLVAMSTHGHRFFADLFFGTTVTKVRHSVNVPVLLLKAK